MDNVYQIGKLLSCIGSFIAASATQGPSDKVEAKPTKRKISEIGLGSGSEGTPPLPIGDLKGNEDEDDGAPPRKKPRKDKPPAVSKVKKQAHQKKKVKAAKKKGKKASKTANSKTKTKGSGKGKSWRLQESSDNETTPTKKSAPKAKGFEEGDRSGLGETSSMLGAVTEATGTVLEKHVINTEVPPRKKSHKVKSLGGKQKGGKSPGAVAKATAEIRSDIIETLPRRKSHKVKSLEKVKDIPEAESQENTASPPRKKLCKDMSLAEGEETPGASVLVKKMRKNADASPRKKSHGVRSLANGEETPTLQVSSDLENPPRKQSHKVKSLAKGEETPGAPVLEKKTSKNTDASPRKKSHRVRSLANGEETPGTSALQMSSDVENSPRKKSHKVKSLAKGEETPGASPSRKKLQKEKVKSLVQGEESRGVSALEQQETSSDREVPPKKKSYKVAKGEETPSRKKLQKEKVKSLEESPGVSALEQQETSSDRDVPSKKKSHKVAKGEETPGASMPRKKLQKEKVKSLAKGGGNLGTSATQQQSDSETVPRKKLHKVRSLAKSRKVEEETPLQSESAPPQISMDDIQALVVGMMQHATAANVGTAAPGVGSGWEAAVTSPGGGAQSSEGAWWLKPAIRNLIRQADRKAAVEFASGGMKDGRKHNSPTKHALRKKIRKEKSSSSSSGSDVEEEHEVGLHLRKKIWTEKSSSSSSGSDDEEEHEVGLLGKRKCQRTPPSKRENSSSSSFSDEEEREVGQTLLSRDSREHKATHASGRSGEIEEECSGGGSRGREVVGGEGQEVVGGEGQEVVGGEGQEFVGDRQEESLRGVVSNTLFVGNLSFNVSEEELKKFFNSNGHELESVRIITSKGKSRGYGYVDFASCEDASRALANLHDTDLDGRTLQLDYAQKELSTPKFDVGDNTLFVGNLSFNVSEEELKKFFNSNGHELESVRIMTTNGKSKGYGYVDFASCEDASRALANLHDTDLDGRTLRLDYAQKEPSTPKFGKSRVGRVQLFIRLSSTTEEETVQELFPEAVDVYLPRGCHRERRGFGFIAFEDVATAEKARSEFDGHEVDGVNIGLRFVTECFVTEWREGRRGRGRGGFRGRGAGSSSRGQGVGLGSRGRSAGSGSRGRSTGCGSKSRGVGSGSRGQGASLSPMSRGGEDGGRMSSGQDGRDAEDLWASRDLVGGGSARNGLKLVKIKQEPLMPIIKQEPVTIKREPL